MVLSHAHVASDARAMAAASRAPRTISRSRACPDSAPGFWGGTCSARCAAPGRTRAGRAGGARTRRTTCPTFVLTHHPRAPLPMKGGTEFRFVTDGIHAALEQAKAAAGGKDIRLGGGVVDHPAVPAGAAHRRAAPRHRAGIAGPRGEPPRRDRPSRARLRVREAHPGRASGGPRDHPQADLDSPIGPPDYNRGSDGDGHETASARPLPAHGRRRAARLGRNRHGPGPDQGGELAEPSRIRAGEPGLGALVPLLWRPLSIPALGRTRLRVDGSRGRRAVVRALDRGHRGRGGRLRSRGAVRDAGDLLGRRVLRRLRRAPSGAGLAADSLRRLRSRLGAAQRFGERAPVPRDAGAHAGRLGKRESRLPPGLHVALHPRRQRGADRLVQRAVPADEHRRDGGADCSRRARRST